MDELSEKERIAQRAIALSSVLYGICKAYIIENGDKIGPNVVSEALTAYTAAIVQFFFLTHDPKEVKGLVERFSKNLNYAVYMYDQTYIDESGNNESISQNQ